MPAAFKHTAHDGVALLEVHYRDGFPVLSDQPDSLRILEDEADLCLSGFSLNQQQGPALDLGPADDGGMGCSLPSVTSTWPPMVRSDRYAVFPSGRRM